MYVCMHAYIHTYMMAVRHHLVEAGSPPTQAPVCSCAAERARSCLRDAHCCCDTHCCALLLSMRCRRLLRSSFDHRIFFKKSSPRKCSLTLSMPRISSSVKWGKRVRRGQRRRGVRKTKTRFGAIIRQTLLIAFGSTKFHDHSF